MIRHLLGASLHTRVSVKTDAGEVGADVRPPTVREALTVLHTTEGAARLDPDDLDLFQDTVKGWLPPALYRELFPACWKLVVLQKLAAFFRRRRTQTYLGQLLRLEMIPGVQSVSEIISSYVDPSDLEPPPDDPDTPPTQRAQDVDWSTLFAEYCRAYGATPAEALEESWPLFLELSGRVSTLEARDDLRLLTVRAVPYIKDDDEREDVLEALNTRARIPGHTPEEKALAAERQAKAEKLMKAASVVGALYKPS